MRIERKGFPSIISDNEEMYLLMIQGVVESVDPDSSLLITRKMEGISFRIAPTEYKYINPLIGEINNINNLFQIRVNYSKSIKSSCTINFDIESITK